MIPLLELLKEYSETLNPPFEGSFDKIGTYTLPAGYLDVVRAANGFVLRGGLFRWSGTVGCDGVPSILEWNQRDWVKEYGDLLDRTVLFAEDIFGNQYGFRYNGQAPQPVKFFCEGGHVKNLTAESVEAWLRRDVLSETPTAFDLPLAREAASRGIAPTRGEHLAFSLPLIADGKYSVENLEQMASEFHLHLLGQISVKNRFLRDGTSIQGFSET